MSSLESRMKAARERVYGHDAKHKHPEKTTKRTRRAAADNVKKISHMELEAPKIHVAHEQMNKEDELLSLLVESVTGQITQGQLLQQLRKRLLGYSQEQYADFVGVSRKSISDIECDRGNPRLDVLTKVFKPFGLQPSFHPRSKNLSEKLLEVLHQSDCSPT